MGTGPVSFLHAISPFHTISNTFYKNIPLFSFLFPNNFISLQLFHAERHRASITISINKMQNPYYIQSASIRKIVKEQLPHGLDTTTDLLLEFMSKSKDEQLRDTAAFIKASKKSEEIGMVFNFTMSLLQHDVVPIREAIFEAGIDGIKELKDLLTEKFSKDENVKANAKVLTSPTG